MVIMRISTPYRVTAACLAYQQRNHGYHYNRSSVVRLIAKGLAYLFQCSRSLTTREVSLRHLEQKRERVSWQKK